VPDTCPIGHRTAANEGGLPVKPTRPPTWGRAMSASRGVSFEHKRGTVCADIKFHRHCHGRWRGSVSLGFDATGKRIRRRVTGPTKTAVLEAMAELREELSHAPRSSSK
jgi:hypothetical protein